MKSGVGDVEGIVSGSVQQGHGISRQRQGEFSQRKAGTGRVIEPDDARAFRAHVGGGETKLG